MIPLHVVVQFSQHHLLLRLISPIVYPCLLCRRLIDHASIYSFLSPPFGFIDLCVCSVPGPYRLDLSCHSLQLCRVSAGKSADGLMRVLLYLASRFSRAAFKILSLICVISIITCLEVGLFGFI